MRSSCKGARYALRPAAVARGTQALGLAAVKAVVCITGIIAGGRVVLRPIYRRISDLNNAEIFAACTLLVVLGTSVLTQAAGLSLALGAFLVRTPEPLLLTLANRNYTDTLNPMSSSVASSLSLAVGASLVCSFT